jgi:hypothetical protein
MTQFVDNAWFAGFADGEGCFYLGPSANGGVQPQFKIGLRADDVSILRELQVEFGGSISFAIQRKNGREHSLVNWAVAGKVDLARLIAYFDEFPLRAKKARDYAIWREGVRAYLRAGRQAPELHSLRRALADGRVFESEPPEISDPPFEQLRVVEGDL